MKVLFNALGPHRVYHSFSGKICKDGDVLETDITEAKLIFNLKFGVPYEAELETKTKTLVEKAQNVKELWKNLKRRGKNDRSV